MYPRTLRPRLSCFQQLLDALLPAPLRRGCRRWWRHRADNGEATHARTTPAADVGVGQFNSHPRADFHCAPATPTELGPDGKARLQSGLGNLQHRNGHSGIGAERHQTARHTHGLARNFRPAHAYFRSGNVATDPRMNRQARTEIFQLGFSQHDFARAGEPRERSGHWLRRQPHHRFQVHLRRVGNDHIGQAQVGRLHSGGVELGQECLSRMVGLGRIGDNRLRLVGLRRRRGRRLLRLWPRRFSAPRAFGRDEWQPPRLGPLYIVLDAQRACRFLRGRREQERRQRQYRRQDVQRHRKHQRPARQPRGQARLIKGRLPPLPALLAEAEDPRQNFVWADHFAISPTAGKKHAAPSKHRWNRRRAGDILIETSSDGNQRIALAGSA